MCILKYNKQFWKSICAYKYKKIYKKSIIYIIELFLWLNALIFISFLVYINCDLSYYYHFTIQSYVVEWLINEACIL